MVVVLRAGQQVLKNCHFLPKRQNAVQKYITRNLKIPTKFSTRGYRGIFLGTTRYLVHVVLQVPVPTIVDCRSSQL
eukprot:SAG11_NODE_1718_length_4382_cov_2.032687_4_plen_76_part_00